jgi:hypothetical protein
MLHQRKVSAVALSCICMLSAQAQQRPTAPQAPPAPAGKLVIGQIPEPRYFIELDVEAAKKVGDKSRLYQARPDLQGDHTAGASALARRLDTIAELPGHSGRDLEEENRRLRTQNQLLTQKVALLEQKIDDLTQKK